MRCPVCGAPAKCDVVDIGVGKQQISPYRCTRRDEGCEWVHEMLGLDDEDGWKEVEEYSDFLKDNPNWWTDDE